MDIIQQLKRDEGKSNGAYPDPLSGGEPWTIGYGHTGGIKEGDHWNDEECDKWLLIDIRKHTDELMSHLPWAHSLSDARLGVLINMCFNMGINGLLKFKNTLQMIKDGQYEAAAEAMLKSLWAKQVGGRAKRLSKQMATNIWQ